MKISVVGLGKLGSCLMAVLASSHEVLGVDTSDKIVRSINDVVAPVEEPGLQSLMTANRERFTATTNYERIKDTDVTFVIVPTPSNEDGTFNNDFVLSAATSIGKAIRTKTSEHLVVITSTVMPGTTAGPVREQLEMFSGRTVGVGLGLCYSPHLIALGSVIRDMQYPDLLLVGESHPDAGDWLQEILGSMVMKEAPIARLGLVEAEVAKLSINAYVTMKISFANTLAEICEGINRTDAVKIAEAIGLDSRIGGKYLRPATAFAGTCFPRDNDAFLALAKASRVPAPLAQATMDVNDRQVGRLANLVERVTPLDRPIGILGMAYKPLTPVTTASVGRRLSMEMASRGYSVVVYDPMPEAVESVRNDFRDLVSYAESVGEVMEKTTTIVVAQPCEEFRPVGDSDATVIDLWGMFTDKKVLRPGIYRWGLST